MAPRAIDLSGQRFGRLTVMERAGKGAQGKARWLCRCDCGNHMVTRSDCLRGQNGTSSCGCISIEQRPSMRAKALASVLRHGACRKGAVWPEYRVWTNIKRRCFNENDADFKHYGERGIGVCDRWLIFENFIEDMGRRPSRYHSIDRRDNDLGYSPDNCRWATRSQQMRNTRRSDYAINVLPGI